MSDGRPYRFVGNMIRREVVNATTGRHFIFVWPCSLRSSRTKPVWTGKASSSLSRRRLNRQIEYRYNYQDRFTSVSQNGRWFKMAHLHHFRKTNVALPHHVNRETAHLNHFEPAQIFKVCYFASVPRELVAEYGYDTNRQRVYAKTYVSPYQSEKYYTWSGGQIIAESDTQGGENIVRYVYSGNQKVAMIRNGPSAPFSQDSCGAATPRPARNGTSGPFGNSAVFPVLLYGSKNEVNDTGKKTAVSQGRIWLCQSNRVLSVQRHGKTNINRPATGLYYFNQRYYDPRIGRFRRLRPRENLALPVRTGFIFATQSETNINRQAFNPYLYAANNPLMYVDPDGQLFFEILGALYGLVNGLAVGIKAAQGGRNFGDGFARGWIDGVKVGGTIGIGLDLCTEGYATYNDANPFFKPMVSTYVAAWQGQAGGSFSGTIGGGGSSGGGRSRTPMPVQGVAPPLDYSLPDVSTWGSEVVSEPNESVGSSVVYRPNVTVTPLIREKLDELSVKLGGQTVIVNSGIRTQEQQDRIRSDRSKLAARISQHTIGHAADIELAGVPNSIGARMVFSTGLFSRVNLYKKTPQGIHVDLRRSAKQELWQDWEVLLDSR